MIRAQLRFDLNEGERLRDEGLELTSGNNLDWIANAIELVRHYAPRKRTFLAEEFRAFPGIGEPKSDHAWGALTRAVLLLRIIKPTGQYAKAKSTRNHGHKYAVYVRCDKYGN